MYPQAIQQLIDTFKRLPGVGPKTAERYALHLCHYKQQDADVLLAHLQQARTQAHTCSVCFSVADQEQCDICRDPQRDRTIVLVVSGAPDIEAYERSGDYKGVYHALRGLIEPIEGIGPEQLTVQPLLERLHNGVVKELILGFDPTVEGEVTTQYLLKICADYPVKLTRIARGLPMGASIEYADDLTLSNALKDRRVLS